MGKWIGYETTEAYVAEIERQYMVRVIHYCRTFKLYYRGCNADGMIRFEFPKWAWTKGELMELNDFIDEL